MSSILGCLPNPQDLQCGCCISHYLGLEVLGDFLTMCVCVFEEVKE